MNIEDLHRKTYSGLADEYEKRVDSLSPATEAAAKAFSSYLKSGRVLDIGCGVGALIEILHRDGFEASGIDLSPEMVVYAKARNPHSKIMTGNFLTTQFDEHYDGIFAFTYIHLFPKEDARKNLVKMHKLLVPGGILYITTTKAKTSTEGIAAKKDYSGEYMRFRKYWIEHEFETFLKDGGFKVLEVIETVDPYDKVWMDFIVQK